MTSKRAPCLLTRCVTDAVNHDGHDDNANASISIMVRLPPAMMLGRARSNRLLNRVIGGTAEGKMRKAETMLLFLC